MIDPETRQRLFDALADLVGERGSLPGLAEVAERASVPVDTLEEFFGSVAAIAAALYGAMVERLAEVLSEQAAGVPVQDRIGTACFVLFDLLEERPGFVRATFDRHAAHWGSPFRQRLAVLLREVLASPDVPGINAWIADVAPVRTAVLEAFVQTVRLWLADESPDRERATALVDRLIGLFSEIVANRTLERGADVVRYAAEAGYLPRWPF